MKAVAKFETGFGGGNFSLALEKGMMTMTAKAGDFGMMDATGWRAGAPLRLQRPDLHLTHQPLYALTIDLQPACIEFVANTTASVERQLKVDLVDQAHQLKVFG